MTCESCGDKPKKCDKDFTKAVIEIDNPEQITLMRRVVIPASMGDDTTVPPTVGKYKNVLLFYEANTKSYLYSSDGIPTQLVNGVTDYEAAVNLPKINGVTLLGNQSSADLKLANAPVIVSLDSGQWSSDKTIGQIFDAFNAGTAIMLDFGNPGTEGTKAWPVIQLGYNTEDNMLLGIVAYAQTENASDFTGEGGYGVFKLHDDHSTEIDNIDWQRKMSVTDDTGLSWDGETLSGVPATDTTIGMVKAGDGLSVDANGKLDVNVGDGLSIDSDNVLNANIGEGLKLDADDNIYAVKHVFDTVADMKASTDLANGDYAKTLGFHTVNDGGGAFYKITNTGTANEMDTVAVGGLYASLINNDEYEVKQFGAYGDGDHDDTSILQYVITQAEATNGVVYFGNGKYIISDTLEISVAIKIEGTYAKGNTSSGVKGTEIYLNTDNKAIFKFETGLSFYQAEFRNIRLNCSDTLTNCKAVDSSSAAILSETIFDTVYFNGHFNVALDFHDSSINTIRNCIFSANITGIRTDSRLGGTYIENCNFWENECDIYATGALENVYISKCHFEHTGNYPNIVFKAPVQISTFTITDDEFLSIAADNAILFDGTNTSSQVYTNGLFIENTSIAAKTGINFDMTNNTAANNSITNIFINQVTFLRVTGYGIDTNYQYVWATLKDCQCYSNWYYGSATLVNTNTPNRIQTFSTGGLTGFQLNSIIKFNPANSLIYSGNSLYMDANERLKWRFSDTSKTAPIAVVQAGGSTNRPSSPEAGQMYYDWTITKPIWWTGTTWVDATGAAV